MPHLIQPFPRLPLIVIGVAALLLVIDDGLPENAYFDPDTVALILTVVIAATAAAMTVPRVGRARLATAAPRVALGLGVSLVVTALALMAAEFATRWIYRDITTTSDDRGYFSHRWLRSGAVSFNRYGFRERDFVAAKPTGTFRLAVLGDSFAFGNGIPAEARFSALVQRALPTGVEVLNFGVPGNNSREHVAVLRRVLGFHPDFILLQWFVNDVEGSELDRPVANPILPVPALHDWLHESSALYGFLDTWRARIQSRGLAAGSYPDYMRSRYGDPQSDAVRVDREAMRTFAALARDARVGLGLVLFPDTGYDLGAAYPFEFLHGRVQEFCAEQRVTCLDLRPDFAAVTQRRLLWANSLDTHPSRTANLIASSRILQVFQPSWRLFF